MSRTLTKITFDKPIYYVDKEKRTVVCKLWAEWNYDMWDNFGTATAAPEDEWDEELGKKIARARAESAAYSRATVLANKWVDTMARTLRELCKLQAKADGVKAHNKRYIASLISGK